MSDHASGSTAPPSEAWAVASADVARFASRPSVGSPRTTTASGCLKTLAQVTKTILVTWARQTSGTTFTKLVSLDATHSGWGDAQEENPRTWEAGPLAGCYPPAPECNQRRRRFRGG